MNRQLDDQRTFDRAPGPALTRRIVGILVILALSAPGQAASRFWDGGGDDDNWTTAANWNAALIPNDTPNFAGSTRLTPHNDFAPGTQFNGIIFNPGAGPFTLGGHAIKLGANISDQAFAPQRIDLDVGLVVSPSFVVSHALGRLEITGSIADADSETATGFSRQGSGELVISGNLSTTGEINVGSSIGAILTLSGDNSAMTGTIQVSSASSTSLNAGRLNINSPTALGNGTLRLGSAAGYANFDNTSGAPLTLTTSHSIELGASARFLGTFDLDLGPVIADRTTSGVFTLSVMNSTLRMGGLGANVTDFTKTGGGTLELTGASTYTGDTFIQSGGTLRLSGESGSLPETNITFQAGGGAFHYVGAAAGSSQSLGTITLTSNENTIQSSYGGSGVTALTLASITRSTSGVVNFDVWGGVNGSTNRINVTGGSAGFMHQAYFFNGEDWAYRDTDGFVRAPIYDDDAGFVNAGAGLTAGSHNRINSSVTNQTSVNVRTLKFDGGADPLDLALADGANLTITNGGILRAGGGSTTIHGGTGAKLLLAGETHFRTASTDDTLIIEVPIATDVTRSLVKSGPGTLVLSAAREGTSHTYVNGGLLILNDAGALGSGLLTLSNGIIGLTSASGDLTRIFGTNAGQIRFLGGGGFAAFGGERKVAIGNSSGIFTWDATNSVHGDSALILGHTMADATLDFVSPIGLNNGQRVIQVEDGSAAIDGRLSGVISHDTGGITKTGAGTLELTATNTYGGETLVNEGTLVVTGSIASSIRTTVTSGATLGGSGTVGNLLVLDGGLLAPGNSPGTLTVSALVLREGAILEFELGSLSGPNDLIAVTGDLLLDGILNVTNLGDMQPGDYTLLTYGGNLYDFGLTLGTMPGSFLYSLSTTGPSNGSVILSVTFIPEPTSAAALLLAGLALIGSRNRWGGRRYFQLSRASHTTRRASHACSLMTGKENKKVSATSKLTYPWLLALTGLLWLGASAAQADVIVTITSDPGDGQLQHNVSASLGYVVNTGDTSLIGTSATAGANKNMAILFFKLPAVTGPIADASLSFYVDFNSGVGQIDHADLWGLGFTTTPTIPASNAWFLHGSDSDPALAGIGITAPPHKIQDDILVGQVSSNTNVGSSNPALVTTDEDGNAALVAFLTAVYAQKPATGDVYAIFRLNMDSDPGLQQEIKRWRILLAETGDTAPTLRMVIPVIPEPASAIMTLAGLSLISSRRRSSRR